MAFVHKNEAATSPIQAKVDVADRFLTVVEVAERLKVNEDTVRRLFLNEPGVVVICFPRKGKRVYRTVRIPESVFRHIGLVYRLAGVDYECLDHPQRRDIVQTGLLTQGWEIAARAARSRRRILPSYQNQLPGAHPFDSAIRRG